MTYDNMMSLLLKGQSSCESSNTCSNNDERQTPKWQVRLRWSSCVVAHRREEFDETVAHEPKEASECVERKRHLYVYLGRIRVLTVDCAMQMLTWLTLNLTVQGSEWSVSVIIPLKVRRRSRRIGWLRNY